MRRFVICSIFVLLGILISCSCPAFGNSVTIFLPMMPPTSCLPRSSELHYLRGMPDSLLLRAMWHSSSSFDPTELWYAKIPPVSDLKEQANAPPITNLVNPVVFD